MHWAFQSHNTIPANHFQIVRFSGERLIRDDGLPDSRGQIEIRSVDFLLAILGETYKPSGTKYYW
jgi:hypothetical protein